MATSLIQAFKAAFEAEFAPTVPGGLLTEQLPRGAPRPNVAMVDFDEESPEVAEMRGYSLTLAVRADAAKDAWGLAERVRAFFVENPARPPLAWTGADGTAELETAQRAYPIGLRREAEAGSEARWIWRADLALELFSTIQ